MNRNDRVMIYMAIVAVLLLIAFGAVGCATPPSLCVDRHPIEQC